MDFTPQQVTDLLEKAKEMVLSAKNTASNTTTSLSQKIKDGLLSHSAAIQELLDKAFKNNNILTKEQVDALDEQLRQTKEQLLSAEANKTKSKFIAYTIGTITVVAILWVLSKHLHKTKN